jgi:hypothetical protein
MSTENFLLKVDGNLKVNGKVKVLNSNSQEEVINYNFRGDFTGIQYNLNDAVVSLGRNFETNMNSRSLYLYKNITCAVGSSPYSSEYGHCWELITNLPDFNPADPLSGLPDNEAGVKIDGWYINGVPVGGQSWRVMNPTSNINGRPAYTYGDETVLWNGSNWEYNNSGYGTLSTGTGNAPYPWQANWTNGFTSEKSVIRS